MPHIIVEHSSDISSPKIISFLPEIQKIMSDCKDGNFDLEQCKARSIAFDHYFVGSKDQKTSSFVHITIKILVGRSSEIRKNLSEKVFNKVLGFVSSLNASKSNLQISVDVCEMARESYSKA
jgi:5-carboxymethyl-2-hydroxymuconate isomerase